MGTIVLVMVTTYPQALAEVVNARMTQQGIKAKTLAESSGIPRTTLLRRLHTGDFTTVELASIARVLETTVVALSMEAEAAA